MIDKLVIKNYKSFALETKIDLAPLNIITGGNSSGKTSILETILIISQIKNHDILNGKLKYLGDFKNIKNNQTQDENVRIAFRNNGSECEVKFNKNEKETIGESGFPENTLYLSAERVGIKDLYEKNRREDFFSSTGEQLVSLLNEFKDDRERGKYYAQFFKEETNLKTLVKLPILKETMYTPKEGFLTGKETFIQIVNIWMELLTGYEVVCKELENTNYVQLIYTKNSHEYKPQHIGTGVTFVLFQIIAALVSPKTDMLIVENPEIHLHPSLQSYMMYFYLWISRQGKQVVIETHSDHLFNSGRYYKSKEEKCNIFFVEAENQEDEQGNVYYSSNVKNIEIGDFGDVINDQPGLFDQYIIDLERMLES